MSRGSKATAAFFGLSFAWKIFLPPPPTFNLQLSLALKQVSYWQFTVGSCCFFFNHFNTLCILIEAFSLLTFKFIIDIKCIFSLYSLFSPFWRSFFWCFLVLCNILFLLCPPRGNFNISCRDGLFYLLLFLYIFIGVRFANI